MKVQIVEHLEGGIRRPVATFTQQNGEVVCDNSKLWMHLMNSANGAIIGERGKRFYPRDGAEYLRNLRYQFGGPYLFAQTLEDDEATTELPSIPQISSSSTLSSTGTWSGRTQDTLALPSVNTLSNLAVNAAPLATARPSSSLSTTTRSEALALPPRPGRSEVTGGSGTSSAPAPVRSRATDAGPAKETLELICSSAFKLSSLIRGMSPRQAHEEGTRLFNLMVEVTQVDPLALKRSYEDQEEYRDLRFVQQTRGNYSRFFDRLQRHWSVLFDQLEAGHIGEALFPLFLLLEGLQQLPTVRQEWRQSAGFANAENQTLAGLSMNEITRSWDLHGRISLRRLSFGRRMLDDVYQQAHESLRRATLAFQASNYGQCEMDAHSALMIDPGLQEARLMLGDVLRRLGRTGEACQELQHMIELEHLESRNYATGSPHGFFRMTRARMALGSTYLATGRVKDAIEQFESALDYLEGVTRRVPAENLQDAERRHQKELAHSCHTLLEQLQRAMGANERADFHRKRMGGT